MGVRATNRLKEAGVQTCQLTDRRTSWLSEHNRMKAFWRTWWMVNTAVVQGKIIFLPGEILTNFATTSWW